MTRDEIFQNVKDVMQAAEEIGGPERAEYIALMLDISREANERAANCLEAMGDA